MASLTVNQQVHAAVIGTHSTLQHDTRSLNLSSSNFTQTEPDTPPVTEQRGFSHLDLPLINPPQFPDIQIQVNGKTYYAHKAILCQSSKFFTSMFDSTFQESSSAHISLQLPADLDFEKIILRYAYTGSLEIQEIYLGLNISIAVVADYLQMDDLLQVVCSKLLNFGRGERLVAYSGWAKRLKPGTRLFAPILKQILASCIDPEISLKFLNVVIFDQEHGWELSSPIIISELTTIINELIVPKLKTLNASRLYSVLSSNPPIAQYIPATLVNEALGATLYNYLPEFTCGHCQKHISRWQMVKEKCSELYHRGSYHGSQIGWDCCDQRVKDEKDVAKEK